MLVLSFVVAHMRSVIMRGMLRGSFLFGFCGISVNLTSFCWVWGLLLALTRSDPFYPDLPEVCGICT